MLKVAYFNPPRLYLASRSNFAQTFHLSKLDSLGYCVALFAWS